MKVKFVIFTHIFVYRFLLLGSMIKFLFNYIYIYIFLGGAGMGSALDGLTLKGTLCPVVFPLCYVYMYLISK